MSDIQSVLRFDNYGIAYAMVDTVGQFHMNTTLSFQVAGWYEPGEVAAALKYLIGLRNTSAYDDPVNNFRTRAMRKVGNIQFNYFGEGQISAIVNRSRVLFCVEANMLNDLMQKCLEIHVDDDF